MLLLVWILFPILMGRKKGARQNSGLPCALSLTVSSDELAIDPYAGDSSLACHLKKDPLNSSSILHMIQVVDLDVNTSELWRGKQVLGSIAVRAVALCEDDNLVFLDVGLDKCLNLLRGRHDWFVLCCEWFGLDCFRILVL